MKKILKYGLVGVLVLIVGAVVVLTMALNKGVQRGVELVAPKITQTSVNLDEVSLSLWSGGGELRGFVVGSPEGYKADSTMAVGEIKVSIEVGSLLSDKYVIRTIQIIEPEITFEGGLKKNNLNKLLENVQSATGGGTERPASSEDTSEAEETAQHKIQVNEFILSGAKVRWAIPGLGGKTVSVVLPTMEMKDLGTGENGITIAELSERVLAAITQTTIRVLSENAEGLGGDVAEVLQGLGSESVGGATEKLKSLGNVFKNKEN